MYVYIFMHVCVKPKLYIPCLFHLLSTGIFETALSQWIQSALNWLNWLVNKPRDSSIESFPALALQVSCWDIIFFSLNECWQPKLMSLYLGSKHCTDWVTFLVFIHAMCYVLIFYSNTLIIIYFLALKEL